MTRTEMDNVLIPLYKEAIQYSVEVLDKAFTQPEPKKPAEPVPGEGPPPRPALGALAALAGLSSLTLHAPGADGVDAQMGRTAHRLRRRSPTMPMPTTWKSRCALAC